MQRRIFHLSSGFLCVALAAVFFAVPAYAQSGPPVPVNDFNALVSNDFLPLATTAAPTLSPWALGALIPLLVLVAFVGIRKLSRTSSILCLSILSLLTIIAVARAGDITTLLGNTVAHLHRPLAGERDFTDAEKAAVAATIAAHHASVIKLSDATIVYNAHGKSFDRRGSWINNDPARSFIADVYSPVTGPAMIGDIVIYRRNGQITHSGLVTLIGGSGAITQIQGKWGSAGEYSHGLTDTPAIYGFPTFFRRRNALLSCVEIQATPEEVRIATSIARNGLRNIWGDVREWTLLMLRVEADIGCSLTSPPAQSQPLPSSKKSSSQITPPRAR